METRTLKQLKKGEWFTLKSIENPNDTQVWIKGGYDRASKTYSCINFSDINRERFFKAGKAVFIGFTF